MPSANEIWIPLVFWLFIVCTTFGFLLNFDVNSLLLLLSSEQRDWHCKLFGKDD